jgi:DNA polymerase I
VEHWIEFDGVSAPTEAAAVLGGDRGASPLSRLVLGPIVYCVTAEEAANAVEVVVRDARGRPIGLDIETAASPAERARLKELTLSFAAARGKLAALRKAKAPAPDIKTATKDAKTLDARRKMAGQAALDPHRSSIRLVQLYGGGDKAYVVDVFRAGQGSLRLLDGLNIVAHNAQFELKHLEHAGVELGEISCTMQATRLLLGERRMSLADACADYLDVALDKTEQAGDWGAPHLTKSQLEYATADAVAVFRLAQKMLPALGHQSAAYATQLSAVPAVARMELRGFKLDLGAHARLIADLEEERLTAEQEYRAARLGDGHKALADRAPSTSGEKEALLTALLSSDELACWRRTEKSGAPSTKRSELLRAGHYPPILALVKLSRIDKILSSFGQTLATLASPATGRIHAHYRVVGTASGRASCASPNLQQVPRDPRFRALFVPEPGCVFVVADYNAMELRAAAYISRDTAMTKVFEQGFDLHKITAAHMTGKAPQEVTEEERRGAKAVNFGGIYGQGADGLVQSAWAQWGLVLDQAEAKAWLQAFENSYRGFAQWRREHYLRCEEQQRIVIGKDANRGIGRVFPKRRVPEGASFYTRCCNLPIQGACADAAMLALAYVDERLFAAGVEGGPVAWLHDEVVVEVCVEDGDRAVDIVKQAMIDGFAETFPGAPLNGLVEPHIGANWGSAKAGEIRTASGVTPEPDFALVHPEPVKLLIRDVDEDEAKAQALDHAVVAYDGARSSAGVETSHSASQTVMGAFQAERTFDISAEAVQRAPLKPPGRERPTPAAHRPSPNSSVVAAWPARA